MGNDDRPSIELTFEGDPDRIDDLLFGPRVIRESARDILLENRKPILTILCSKCRAQVGGIHGSPAGLLMILNHQKPKARRQPKASDTYDVFVVAKRKPLERDFCRCGHRPLNFTYERLDTYLTANRRTMSV